MDMVKNRLVFRSGQRKTVKVWRFSPDHIDYTTLKEVEENILQLYPDVMSRRLGLLMKYQDSFAGEIVVESNMQVHNKLSFIHNYCCSFHCIMIM